MTKVTRASLVERILSLPTLIVAFAAALLALAGSGIVAWMRDVDWPLVGLGLVLVAIVLLTLAMWLTRLAVTR